MAHAPLGNQFGQKVVMMRPSELAAYAEDRTSDLHQKRHVEDLAAKISRQGYRGKQHDHPVLARSNHIHLVHTNDESFLNNGNHRVAAMTQIGYDKPVPVRLSDFRT